MRLELQDKVIEISERLNAENDPNYGDIYIQHESAYKIVVLDFLRNNNFIFFETCLSAEFI